MILSLGVLVFFMPHSAQATESAQELFAAGSWNQASEEALVRDDADSLRLRALFAHWAGEDEDALHFARAATGQHRRESERRRAQVMVARLEWFEGRRDEAIERLRAELRQAPNDGEVRFELGWRLVDDGRVDEGKTILEGMARRYNDGLITDADELLWLGRSMMAAQRPRDANRALSRILEEDEDHIEANLRLGQLMWSRYNTAEAEGAFTRVLERQPDHPEALIGMAEIEFYRSGRFVESMELVERAHSHYPGHPDVERARAHLLNAQGRWEEGRAVARGLLDRAPEDGEALSHYAASTYLLGDVEAFDQAQSRFDERRANRPDLLARVAEFAALNNRHRDAVSLYEQALLRDDEHGPSLSGLGIALTRVGEESRGLDVLERAFRADRYHVRVYNMLELYERGLRDYLTDDIDGVTLRAHIDQFDLLSDMIGPLVREAREDFSERYGVELPSLTLEVYADLQTFSVRTVGLPHIHPHGICFGRVVLSRSPSDGNFNWAMVIWHELAHSYHLELSNERVPRWFTEGLAEYETWRRDPSWTRFHDVDIARRLAHGTMWSITEMDQVFMTGRGVEVSHAYQVGHLIMMYLEETFGFEAIVEMLQRFGQEPRVDRVFEEVLERDIAAVDREFEDWLRIRYASLLRGELVDWLRVLAMRDGQEVEHGSRGEGAAYRALLAATQGEEGPARLHLENAGRRGADEAAVAVITVMVYDLLDDVEAGLQAGRQALDAGVESIDLRFALSRLAGRAERHEEAYIHALSAAMLYPDEPDAWRELVLRARAAGEGGQGERAVGELFARQAHAPHLARQRVGTLEERGDYDGAYEAALRWTHIATFDAEAHLALARNALRSDDVETARRSFGRAAMAAPARRVDIWNLAAQEFRQAGAREIADSFDRLAAQEESSSPSNR